MSRRALSPTTLIRAPIGRKRI
ncbi:unnamed protein product [Medioppia subpectinata]|uniref:Uncharacterized protein n=1 Tax=Medioppia subpectinata TaxID=1979941 RepID=A0A7R9KXW2_9ACAR|nr:unnamed protein product [Medioppia subpectinata]CAG2111537.1 unnamed protein product [Medioppia subpectinata]